MEYFFHWQGGLHEVSNDNGVRKLFHGLRYQREKN
jgi:hypothetical protein